MTTSPPECLDHMAVSLLTIRTGTRPGALAQALLGAAVAELPLTPSAAANWRAQSTPGKRKVLVLRLARVIPHVDGHAGKSLARLALRPQPSARPGHVRPQCVCDAGIARTTPCAPGAATGASGG